MRRLALILFLVFAALLFLRPVAAQDSPAPQPGRSSAGSSQEDFLKAADEVVKDMSAILSLPQLSPLKKSVRTREEIRAFVIRQMKEDKSEAERYAGKRTLEKLGLLPKGFELDAFLVELLTEQIAGLYDPKGHEFYIADWNSPEDQKMVMAHELTHALQDQHFQIEKWEEAAKPNDDAQLARDAVLEGSALAAMVDYLLKDTGKGVRQAPEINPELFIGDPTTSPVFAKAPQYIQDSLLFPYVAGLSFTQAFLRANSGWADLHKVFENPPVSTQQILHPELYLHPAKVRGVTLPDLKPIVPPQWKKLEENVLGEFGLREVLKQFLGKDRAVKLAAPWVGDRYATFEDTKAKNVLMVYRIRMASAEDAARLLGNYSEALELKYGGRHDLFRRPNYFSFATEEGGVFLRCLEEECAGLEGGDQEMFDKLTAAMGWPAGPKGVPASDRPIVKTEAVLIPASYSGLADQAAR
ncbi:MAG TPA: hypothetical protein VEU31_00020 [Candidatus Acidoferrales bacterium]|nr:hypothetical protein [Candidatus Acidoferrales bacterium]